MQQLIADYLFENKQCEIPNLGVLTIQNTPATYNFGEQTMGAPKPVILFEQKEIDNDNFSKYVANKKNINLDDANNLLMDFSENIHSLPGKTIFDVDYVGRFSRNLNVISFKNINPNPTFSPTVNAIKVIHPNAAHNITVGDTETDSAAMTEYYAEEETITKNRWWIWALGLALVSITGLLYHFFGGNIFPNVGNATPIEIFKSDSTYRIIK